VATSAFFGGQVVPAPSVVFGIELFLNSASSDKSTGATSTASFHAQLRVRAAEGFIVLSTTTTLVGVGTSHALLHGVLFNAGVIWDLRCRVRLKFA